MITQPEARGEIFALFKTAWDANSATVVGYIPEIEYQGLARNNPPDSNKNWCRISIQAINENQTSFSNEDEKKQYTAYGLVFVQIFSPRSEANGFGHGLLLAQIAKKAFRGKTTAGAIWFRNVRINELEPENSFYRLNVVAEYEYDELG